MNFIQHHMRINFSRQEVLIMLLGIVTSLFAFSLSYAENNDAQAPIIIIKWEATITINTWETYTDEWVIAYDFQQWFITQYVKKQGAVDTSTPWVYTVTYNVRDVDGNNADEATRTITVLGEIKKAEKPTISSISVKDFEWTIGKIYFKTNEKTQAVVGYWENSNYGLFSKPQTSFKFSSHIQKLENLEEGKTYDYLIYVRNQEGLSNYTKGSFTTPTNKIIEDVPQFLSKEVKDFEWTTAKIYFETIEKTQAVVTYWLDWKFDQASKAQTSFKFSSHIQTLENLELGKTYGYNIYVENELWIKNTISGEFTTPNSESNNNQSFNTEIIDIPNTFDDFRLKRKFSVLWEDETLGISDSTIKNGYNTNKNWVYPVRRLSIWESPDGKKSLIHTVKKPLQIEPVWLNLKTVPNNPKTDWGYAVKFDFYSTWYSWHPWKIIQLEWGRGWVWEWRFRRGTEFGTTWWWVNLMRPTSSNKNYFRLFGSHANQWTEYWDNFTWETSPYKINSWNSIVFGTFFKEGSNTLWKYFIYVNGKKYLETNFLHLPDSKTKTLNDTNAIHVFLRLMDWGNPDKMIEWASYVEYFRNMALYTIGQRSK